MKHKTTIAIILILFINSTFGQTIKKIDGSEIYADSLNAKIEYLMKIANVSGVAISVFNGNKPVFSNTFGLANVQQNEPLTQNSIMYACSFAKNVFAYIAMQLIEEKKLDLDKPLVEYLDRQLVDIKIEGFKRGYQDLKYDNRLNKITARMCLTHSTGFPNCDGLKKTKN